MSDNVKTGLLAAYRHLLRPLVRMLIRSGVAFNEFAESAKQVYVKSARDDFGIPGKKMTASRVAILTGLTRKDVRRLLEIVNQNIDADIGRVHRAARVLEGWHQDPDFTGPYGIPVELPFEGERVSFTELVRRYSGDMPARAMLEELKRVNAVAEADRKIKVLSRSYISHEIDPKNAKYFGDVVHDLAATIEFNFNRKKDEPQRFERWVMYDRVQTSTMPEFHLLVNAHGQKLLEILDNWLSTNEVPESQDGKIGTTRTRVGIYLYQEDSHGSDER